MVQDRGDPEQLGLGVGLFRNGSSFYQEGKVCKTALVGSQIIVRAPDDFLH